MEHTRHIAYIRVSTESQDHGPAAQKAAIDRWAAANGASIDSYHSEVVSGGAPLEKRVVLMDAISSLEAGDVLVAAKRDRIGRDVMLTAMVERLVARKGAKLMVAEGADNGDGPEAKLMRTMIDAFAEYERAIIKSRTRAALQSKKERGEAPGGNPAFGWRKVGKDLVRDEAEQAVIARIKALRTRGTSIRKIASQLEADGVPPRGACWHQTTVARILKSC